MTMSLSSNAQCASSFTYTTSGNTITVTDASNLLPGIGRDFYWNFGDSYIYTTKTNLVNFQHTYGGSGTFVVCLYISDSLANCTDTYCDTLSVDSNGIVSKGSPGFTIHVGGYTCPTGIQEETKLDVNIYPNPVQDEVFIELKGVQKETTELRILNGLGQQVMPMQIVEAGRNETVRLDLSTLGKGLYFIQLTSSDERLVKKLVKY